MSLKEIFSERILASAPKGYLAALGKDAFEKRIEVLWALFERRTKPVKVDFVNQKDFKGIFVNLQEQPFVVDTIELILKRENVPHRAIVYLTLKVKRNASGELENFTEGGHEILVFVELYPEVSEERARKITRKISSILPMVQAMVEDFLKMKKFVRDAVNDVEFLQESGKLSQEEAEESAKFLEWVIDDNFVFCGYGEITKEKIENGKGILRADFSEEYLLNIDEIPTAFKDKKEIIVVEKLSSDSWIHRTGKLDLIGCRLIDEEGNFCGWRFWIGLWAKKAVSTKGSDVPLLRQKLFEIVQKKGVVMGSHEHKKIVEIFNAIPIEDLFTSSVEEIEEVIDAILNMQEEIETHVIIREKGKGLTSVMVMIPESRFSMNMAEQLKHKLTELFKSDYADMRFSIYEGTIALISFFLTPREKVEIDSAHLKREIEKLTAEWDDLFREELRKRVKKNWENLFFKFTTSLPEDYKASVSPSDAVTDVLHIEKLKKETPFKVALGENEEFSLVKIYSLFEWKLSDAVPVLENFYLSIWDEKPFKISLPTGETIHMHIYRVLTKEGKKLPKDVYDILSEAITAVVGKKVESDPLNSLVLLADLTWRSIDVLRTYRNYIRQIMPSIAFSTVYNAFRTYPHLVKLLWQYFDTKFNPHTKQPLKERSQELRKIEEQFYEGLNDVSSIAEDKVFRTYFNAIQSTIRTNFYREDKSSHYISIKIDCSKILDMPLPRPMYEIYVHEYGMEGVHLRGGKIARGGIRWSDRPDDFRTEILGLMKTQMVKNAIIVPTGAKGGFIIKLRYYNPSSREELEELVKKKYTFLIRGMLDITDNIVDGKIINPPNVIRYDDNDPYLVVAADKGTAKLSDLANSIAREYNFWLDDAFASGGSTGYDHKKMGVTAKGAWVCVRRHFMEMGIDPEKDIITVVGIGDMSGDVFGNGMLLSRTIKLIAAFNHRVIFVDPDPDPEISYRERLRLFKEAKDWDHYNPKLISKGGGVYRRDAKRIVLSEEARKALGTDKTEVSGEELIKIILRAPVDLLWNGGIGTYVKASYETNEEVGDPPNDNVRVNANELRVKVVGEGGNLGFTQKARVEYASSGGRINMDALDNSGGVDTSDHEVNLKILLSSPLKENKLSWEERNKLIFDIADEVLKSVLKNNYTQSLAVSLDVIRSKRDLEPFSYTIEKLIEDGLIDPRDVFLPSKKELRSRKEKGIGLYRPELSLLIGFQKRWVKEKMKESSLLKAEYMETFLYEYFPETVRERFSEYINRHPLKEEIILTYTTNYIVDQAGISFYHKAERENGAGVEETTASYIMMDGVLNAKELRNRIYQLDFKVPSEIQYQALTEIEDTIEELVRWSHFFIGDWLPLTPVVDKYRQQVDRLKDILPTILSAEEKSELMKRIEFYENGGIDKNLARDLALLPFLSNSLDIFTLAEALEMDPMLLAGIYHSVSHRFMIDQVEDALLKGRRENIWDHMAYNMLHRELYFIRRRLVRRFVSFMRSNQSDLELFATKEMSMWDSVAAMVREALEQTSTGISTWYVIINRMKEVVV